jgi:hypothetical protein
MVVDEKMRLVAIPVGGDSPFGEIEREAGGLDVETNREDNDALEFLLDKPDSKADCAGRCRDEPSFGNATGAPEAEGGGSLRGAAWSDGVMERPRQDSVARTEVLLATVSTTGGVTGEYRKSLKPWSQRARGVEEARWFMRTVPPAPAWWWNRDGSQCRRQGYKNVPRPHPHLAGERRRPALARAGWVSGDQG